MSDREPTSRGEGREDTEGEPSEKDTDPDTGAEKQPDTTEAPPPEDTEPNADATKQPDTTGEPSPNDAANRREPLDADGMARPAFLLDFPRDPALEPLIDAFERGDYAFVREHAEKVAAESTRDDVRDAARELRHRIDPDPLARYIIGASVLLLLFLVAWTYLGHEH